MSGFSIPETVVTAGQKGRTFASLQNLENTTVKVQRGAEIGTVEPLLVAYPSCEGGRAAGKLLCPSHWRVCG